MFHNAVRARKMYKTRRENPIKRDFIRLYRFSRNNVEWMAEHFLGVENDEETRGARLDAFTKMKIFLRYAADPGFQIGVAEDIGVSQPTVSCAVKLVTEKIVDKAHLWIRFPQVEGQTFFLSFSD